MIARGTSDRTSDKTCRRYFFQNLIDSYCISFISANILIGPKSNSDTPATLVRPAVPVNDRPINAEAIILGFLAENDLPFTITPNLIKLCQQLAKHPKALNELKMDRCTASYKMTFGLASFFTKELVEELKNTFFCLNLDESTN